MGRPRKPWPPTFDPKEATKRCVSCGEVFPDTGEFFYRNASKPTGWENHCKGCGRRARRRSYFKHHETNQERAKSPQARFQQVRNGARQRDLVWGLSLSEFEAFWDQPCHYCGDPIETIGLDRVDNAQGYVSGNVVACCAECNRMKVTLTTQEWFDKVFRIARSIERADN